MSVPLQSVPENSQEPSGSSEDEEVSRAKHEAAEIVASARREAEAILAEARTSSGSVPSPLAALGDNAEEIIGQVRKLIKKQRLLQTERQEMQTEIDSLKSERDELVQRLTDAVVRMEELATMAATAQSGTASQPPAPQPPAVRPSPPPPPPSPPLAQKPPPSYGQPRREAPADDTSLAARLRQAERDEGSSKPEEDDSSLAARLERAERERNEQSAAETEAAQGATFDAGAASEQIGIGADKRSFYDRHSAKLPRLEGDGGRSVLSAIGDMRPESEPKGRKGRRRKK